MLVVNQAFMNLTGQVGLSDLEASLVLHKLDRKFHPSNYIAWLVLVSSQINLVGIWFISLSWYLVHLAFQRSQKCDTLHYLQCI